MRIYKLCISYVVIFFRENSKVHLFLLEYFFYKCSFNFYSSSFLAKYFFYFYSSSFESNYFLLLLKYQKSYTFQLWIPYEVSLDRRCLCVTLSKALAKSRRIASIYPITSSTHGLSLLVETRKTVLTEIHVESEGCLV